MTTENNAACILFVEDDPYVSDIIKNMLETEGFIVNLFHDGQTALDHLADTRPDLVLLDIKMPGMDGYEVLRSIRKVSAVPVIMLTGVHEIESLARCFELGANDYIRKPYRSRELVARIRAKLRRPD